jgi:hypothetical protein
MVSITVVLGLQSNRLRSIRPVLYHCNWLGCIAIQFDAAFELCTVALISKTEVVEFTLTCSTSYRVCALSNVTANLTAGRQHNLNWSTSRHTQADKKYGITVFVWHSSA